MQHCSICNYESPAGAKFCRQCGAPLFAESEMTGADTRNYGRQDNAPALSAPLPKPAPSVVDAFGPETARQYSPPPFAPSVGTSSLPNVGPNYGPNYGQNYAAPVYVPPVSHTAPIKPKRRLLKLGGAALLLFIAGGIGAGINQESQRQRVWLGQDDRARLEQMRTADRLNHALVGSVVERSERLKEDLERRLEDVERAKDEANRAAERGLTGLDEKPLDLSNYEYPGATSGQYSRIPGKELTTLRTKDDFETIVQYYQSKLGKPYLTLTERNNKRALFQSAGTPSVTVLVQETNDRNREKIYAMRSPFRFPKLPGVLANQTDEASAPATVVVDGKIDGKPVIAVETRPAKPAPPAPAAPPAKAPKAPEER